MNRTAWLTLTSIGVVTLGLLAANLGSFAPVAVARPAPADSPPPILPDSPGAADVVDAADAFLATLSGKERAAAQVELSADLAGRWSNFPDGVVPRNGVFFRDLKPEQVKAALKVVRLALSPEGFARFEEIRAGDDLHGAQGPGPGPGGPPQGKAGQPKGKTGGLGKGGVRFGATHYMIAFLGKPSKTSPWMLQLGGHHLAFNIYYKGTTGSVPPYFVGVEPLTWKDSDGKTHAPLAPMRDAMYGLVNALTPEQRGRARIDARFNDIYVGPGRDGKFPSKEGMPASELSEGAKQSLKQAFAAWTGDSLQSAYYRKLYEAEIDQTRVAYSGGTTLDEVGDYVRIDGPHAWIEFSCQRGVHYHTIWRDRATDYGAEFSF